MRSFIKRDGAMYHMFLTDISDSNGNELSGGWVSIPAEPPVLEKAIGRVVGNSPYLITDFFVEKGCKMSWLVRMLKTYPGDLPAINRELRKETGR